jgi:exosortase
MQSSLASTKTVDFGWRRLGWVLIPILAILLWVPEVQNLWISWRDDPSLSHGPIVPFITAALLWMRRSELREWGSATRAGLVTLAVSTVFYICSVWADIDFLRPLFLISMACGAVWYLGGWKALSTSLGALGFLVFMVPWPTTFVAYLAFPLQLLSSAYAAQLAGMLGLPIERSGVNLSVVPDIHGPPIYSIVVAQACSGLTSVIVLLALAYLIAYHTKVALGWRALLIVSVVPMALLLNAVRLTAVLLAGAHYSASVAQWIHDHEEPVLVFFCSLGLVGLRSAMLAKFGPRPSTKEGAPENA